MSKLYLSLTETQSVKNILIVRKHNQIGDMLVSIPMYSALKKKFPNAKITLVAAETNYPIPFFEINPYLDDVIIFKKSSLMNIIKFFVKLRKKKYEIGIVPSTIKISRTSHIINFLSGAKVRVGVRKIDNVCNKSDILLNIKSDFEWNKNKVHQSERNLDVVRQINCKVSEAEIVKIMYDSIRKDNSFAEKFIADHFESCNKLFIGIQPGAGKKENMWPTKCFAEFVERLSRKINFNLLITCGRLDNEIVAELQERINKTKITYTVETNFGVNKLAGILDKMDLYVTNDTGTMHIAGLTKANVIALFGPTRAYEWAPRGKNKFYIQSGTDDVNDISVKEVYDLSISILNKKNL